MPRLNEIGSRHQPVQRTVLAPAFPAQPVELAGQDNRRWAIGFSVYNATGVVVGTVPDDIGNQGIQLPETDIVWITFDKCGAFAQVPWFGLSLAAAFNVTVWELILLD